MPLMTLRALVILAAVTLAACGGGGGTTPANPVPTGPAPTGSNSLTGMVFYDQNGNGTPDADEAVRLPDVRVTVGGQSGTSGAGGQVSVSSLPDGTQAVSIAADSLPPYFQAGRMPTVSLPLGGGTVVPVPVVLSIGSNRPNTYLAFGDSITEGTGSDRRQGFATPLEQRLRAHWGAAEVIVDGVRGSRSVDGLQRLPASLARSKPAFILVLYGTNDWNGRCQTVAPDVCFTVAALRDIIRAARAAGTLPVVGTIIPADPDVSVAERNRWIQLENDLVRPMVQQEGAVLADTWAAFGTDASQWPPLFFDLLHPNDAGYARISDAFFQAITRGRAGR
jgi:lysophospholipase L1-like esterase